MILLKMTFSGFPKVKWLQYKAKRIIAHNRKKISGSLCNVYDDAEMCSVHQTTHGFLYNNVHKWSVKC